MSLLLGSVELVQIRTYVMPWTAALLMMNGK